MLIDIQNLSFGYDDKTLLENIDLTLNDGERVGLIGVNGAGKSTLLKLITGELKPDCGSVIKKSGISIGYLKQNGALDSEKSVFDEMMSVFQDVLNAQNRMRQIEIELSAETPDSIPYRALSSEYQRLNDLIYARDGFNAETKVKTVLGGMGFADRYGQIISTMSGGERTRLYLAKLLLTEPDVLILDEPTNHLDFDTLIWLEEYMTKCKSAAIIVSHDRYFLDKTAEKIWELDFKNAQVYRGNYSKYKILKAEKILSDTRAYEKQAEKIAAMKEYAEKNIVRATTSKSAKSRLHQLENIEVLEKPKVHTKAPKFKFEFTSESMKTVFNVKNYRLQAGGKTLAENASFSVFRGEKAAVIGKNGTGKSTLVKILVSPEGVPFTGGGVRTAYFDQESSDLNPENTVLDEIWHKYRSMSLTDVRNILGRMLLGEDDVHKQIKSLSGGERAKLEFAMVQAERGNTLVLDEPTNHLDLTARESLEDSLKDFAGTILFVSHDRYLLNAVANKIIAIEDGQLNVYPGNYDDYLAAKQKQREAARDEETARPVPVKENAGFKSARQRSEEAKRKLLIKELEENISALEAEEKELLETISQPETAADYKLLNEKCTRLEQVKGELENLLQQWERAQ